jgi:ribosomal 50S subunit-recycling heat shock protein
VPSPSPEATVASSAALKAGDKVKITINGSAVEATIVSIDEKAGKATVKVTGETKERTVNLSEIVKQ